jgi:tRNA(fMet)-specific endonuclease VapC
VLDDVIEEDDDVAVAAITVAELLVGVELADANRRPARERYVTDAVTTIPIEIYDLDVARAHARLLAHTRSSGNPRGAHDLIIAATALATDRIVLTVDRSGFADLPGVSVRTP